ncbi:hypothetical protein LCGC14_2797630, partial [marine sediment metagenome]
ARAVVFIGADEPAPNVYHHLNFPANLPRFYVTAELAEKLQLRTKPQTVTLRAAGRWEIFEGRNVIGVIRGTKPVFDEKVDEAILLAAPLDSLSEVPALSPGARLAANAAGLLSVAEHLQANRPRRDVIVCFLDGEAANHAGARALYGVLYRTRTKQKMTLAERLEMHQGEQQYIGRIQKVLAWGDIFALKDKQLKSAQSETRTMMRREAKILAADAVRDELQARRMAQYKQKRFYKQLVDETPLLAADEKLRAKLAGLRQRIEAVGEGDRQQQPYKDLKAQQASLQAEAEQNRTRLQPVRKKLEAYQAEFIRLARTVMPLKAEDLSWSQLERGLHKSRLLDKAVLSRPEESPKLESTVNWFNADLEKFQVKQLEKEMGIDRSSVSLDDLKMSVPELIDKVAEKYPLCLAA